MAKVDADNGACCFSHDVCTDEGGMVWMMVRKVHGWCRTAVEWHRTHFFAKSLLSSNAQAESQKKVEKKKKTC